MYRVLALTFALGFSPAFAEDIGASILDGLPTCEGACAETTVTAMSSDLDGDGAAEYFDVQDSEAQVTLAEAECGTNIGATCSMPIDALSPETGHRL